MKRFIPFGLCTAFCLFISLSSTASAQQSRPRHAPETTQKTVLVVPSANNQTPAAAQPPPLVKSGVISQPRGVQAPKVLTNDIHVRPTVSSRPANAASAAALNAATSSASSSAAGFRGRMVQAMTNWLGTPYGYGSEGPTRIDCSALVWRVFNEAGISFDRNSARYYWNEFPAAADAEKTQFGTLVFFNSLGHVGIVIDENTFFHASRSKGVTFSKFEGYWKDRIVGYRRVPLAQIPAFLERTEAAK